MESFLHYAEISIQVKAMSLKDLFSNLNSEGNYDAFLQEINKITHVFQTDEETLLENLKSVEALLSLIPRTTSWNLLAHGLQSLEASIFMMVVRYNHSVYPLLRQSLEDGLYALYFSYNDNRVEETRKLWLENNLSDEQKQERLRKFKFSQLVADVRKFHKNLNDKKGQCLLCQMKQCHEKYIERGAHPRIEGVGYGISCPFKIQECYEDIFEAVEMYIELTQIILKNIKK